MEQDTQTNENNSQAENGVLFRKPKKEKYGKITLLIVAIMIIFGAIALYFSFSSNNFEILFNNVPVLIPEDENTEEVKINKELDSDQDGLPNYIEEILGTDENNSDTDGDSYSDFDEIENGYNPLGDEKYTEEEWEAAKGKIKNESGELYNKMFGSSDKTTSNCDAFPDKLDLCESFLCEFEHPFTGEMMERKIVGLVNDKCQYTEEMPNNGKMDCEYSESLRKAVAQYYRDIVVAESVGTDIKANLGNGDVKTTYTIDGKKVENPLQEAKDSGQCVISGYENSTQDNKCPPGTEYKGETYTYENGEQIAHPICSDPNFVCPSCENCVSGSAKKMTSGVCYECLFDKDCKEGFHCSDHKCVN